MLREIIVSTKYRLNIENLNLKGYFALLHALNCLSESAQEEEGISYSCIRWISTFNELHIYAGKVHNPYKKQSLDNIRVEFEYTINNPNQ